jgi:hypothetical protein
MRLGRSKLQSAALYWAQDRVCELNLGAENLAQVVGSLLEVQEQEMGESDEVRQRRDSVWEGGKEMV